MDLKRLSNSELHKSFIGAVQTERNSLKDVLLHVIEVDRRQLYYEFDRSSLFAYMTEVMGYSNGPAQRRIDAARLSYEVPQLVETIESGALNLDQVRLMQQSIRQVAKESHKPITSEQKIQVLNEIVGKSLAESEVIVAHAFDVKIKKSVRIQRQADESVRMEISFSKEQWAKLEEMRTLLSHSLPTGSWDDVFEYVAEKVIQQRSKLVEKRKYTKKTQGLEVESTLSPSSETVPTGTVIPSRTAIPAEIERQVFQRDQCCQQKSPTTGKKCATKWKLQTDHIVPVWAGGDNSLGNLQLLCASHNRAKYRKEAGISREKLFVH
jgi:5-methylcytosine-specific restriction endonuclease McrA